jgi:tetratricopeptide (TPR) repeat protein
MGWGGFGLGGFGLGGFGWNDWWGPWGYAPMAFQTGYWDYYNPYWHEPMVVGTTVIDYSQPIILMEDPARLADVPEDDPVMAAALAQFDAAREMFARGDYQSALHRARRAMEHLPGDAALHEFVALVHFAQGNYRESAGTVHSILSVGPGWSWETMRSLYPSVATYTEHLRAAEAFRRANPDRADVRFLLAYHYMTTGYSDAAANELRRVLELEPNDTVAARLLQGLTGEGLPEIERSPLPQDLPADADSPLLLPAPADGEAGRAPAADALVGAWSASRDDGAKFSLKLNDDGRFTWTFSHRDQTSELTGQYKLTDDLLILESEQGGAMIGRVNETDDNQFRFRLVGAPENDPGLTFGK